MNKAQLMGNLARDPKVSVTRTGKTLVRMTVAGEPHILDDGTIICKECYDKRYKGADGDEIR